MHDLRLFGVHAFASRDVSRTIQRVIETWRDGSFAIETLADAWDDEQRCNGVSRATRVRRRGTLRALLVHAQRSGLVSRAVALATLDADGSPRTSVYSAAENAIETARVDGRWRDAALLCLVWENGATLRALRSLRIGDLPVPCSRRCADALQRWTAGKPTSAYAFPGRAFDRPIGGETISQLLKACGLRGLVAVRAARIEHAHARGFKLSDMTTQDAASMLAGEE